MQQHVSTRNATLLRDKLQGNFARFTSPLEVTTYYNKSLVSVFFIPVRTFAISLKIGLRKATQAKHISLNKR